MAHDVFISHSSKDKTVADATCAWLERKRIRCWIAPRDITPGANWGSSIVKAIRSSRVMILVFSRHANASPQIKREVERAVNAGVAVIPVRIEDVLPEDDLEYFLGTPHWLDAFNAPLENHLDALAKAVNEILEIPHPPVKADAAFDKPEPVPDVEPSNGEVPRWDEPMPASPKKLPSRLVIGMLFVLVAAAGLGWYFGFEHPAEQEQARQAQIAQQEAIQKEIAMEAQAAAEAAEKARMADEAKKAAAEAEELKNEADKAKAAADQKAADDAAKAIAAEKAALAMGEPFKVTKKAYSQDDSLEKDVVHEFGENYRTADWNDVVAYCKIVPVSKFIKDLDIQWGDLRSPMVTFHNQQFWGGDRHFFIARWDHDLPGGFMAHENIDNNYLVLGSFTGLHSHILCIKKSVTDNLPGE